MPKLQIQEKYLDECIKIAQRAVLSGNHPFGALLTLDGEVVLTSQNEVISLNDVTAHAELRLIQKAQQVLTKVELSRSILYSSTEPCAMCSGAIYWAGIKKVIFGCTTEDLYLIVSGGLSLSSKEVFSRGSDFVSSTQVNNNKSYASIHNSFW